MTKTKKASPSKKGQRFYGGDVTRRLIEIGWSERELARRTGRPQTQVTRIANGDGTKHRLTVKESRQLHRIAQFIVRNPMPRIDRPDPDEER